MTARSTRKAAEAAIIDAAYEWRKHYLSGLPGNEGSLNARFKLERAVAAHEALGLAMPDRPAFSNNSTTTSAAAPIKDKVGPDARRCFDEILIVWRGGGIGLTCDQIEQATGFTHQNASARVNGLRDGGWIADSGKKRLTRSNRMAIIWTPSHHALVQEGLR